MKKNLLLGIFFFTMVFVLGQPSEAFNGPLENIHLHLNKTSFLQGERLWFKAYVQNQNTKLPPLETSNLHVGIFTDNGEEVKRKLFLVENGMAQGDFAIDSTLVETEYVVLAWTNYMRNFKELEPFRQRIMILRDVKEAETKEGGMTISVYPEGGQLIAGTYNSIGILISNSLGQGVKVNDLDLVDEKGEVLRKKIATNSLGMGKVSFVAESGDAYYLQRQRSDGIMIKAKLPPLVSGQFGIRVDNKEADKVRIEMIGSEALFKANDGEYFSLAVYQDEFIGFENFEVNADKPVIWFPREQMPYGVVTAVLFDKELRPVSHRMFFNHKDDIVMTDLEIDHCLTKWGDSIQIDVLLPPSAELISNISLSALPLSSRANNPNNSIISSFLVNPYVVKGIQNRYYFEVDDRQRRFELDQRLLIEGWGKYEWDSRKWEERKLEFEMEKGIPISGRIMDANLNYENQVLLHTDLSRAFEYVELEAGRTFDHSMNLFEGDSLSFSLIGSGGNLRKPKVVFELQEDVMEVMNVGPWLNPQTLQTVKDDYGETIFDQPLDLDKRTIALDEVTVSDRRRADNSFQITPFVEGRLIGEEEIKRYPSLVGYIARLGFSAGNPVRQTGYPRGPVPVFVDGVIASYQEWVGIPLRNVANVVFSKNHVYRPFISITLNSDYISSERRDQFIKFAIEKGYARPRNYFAPDYPDYTSNIFKKYGVLDWKPNVIVGNEIPTSITVPLKNQNGVLLFIEGLVSDGSLISQKVEVQLPEAR